MQNMTRIVRETDNAGRETFYVEDRTPHLWGLFYTWERPLYFRDASGKSYNIHYSKDTAEKWIADRKATAQARDKLRYERQIAKVDVVS